MHDFLIIIDFSYSSSSSAVLDLFVELDEEEPDEFDEPDVLEEFDELEEEPDPDELLVVVVFVVSLLFFNLAVKLGFAVLFETA